MRDNVEAESPADYFRKSITVTFLYCTLRDRPIKLQRGLWFFFSFRKICSDNTRVRNFFFQNLTLGYITKTLNQIFFFFSSTKIRIFISATLGIRIFF
jgi:hypothetical protein